MTDAAQPRRSLVRATALVLAVLGGFWLFHGTELAQYARLDHLQQSRSAILAWGHWAPIVFVLLGTTGVAVGFPRLVLSAIGGVAFGPWGGTIYAMVGTLLGSILTFQFARRVARKSIEERFKRRWPHIRARLRQDGFPLMLLIRLCPIGNNYITNLLAGASPVRSTHFILASSIGFLPETAIFAMLGDAAVRANTHMLALALFGLLLLTAGFWWLYRRTPMAHLVVEDLTPAPSPQKDTPRSADTPGAVL